MTKKEEEETKYVIKMVHDNAELCVLIKLQVKLIKMTILL